MTNTINNINELLKEKKITESSNFYGASFRSLSMGIVKAINDILEYSQREDGENDVYAVYTPHVRLRQLLNVPFGEVSYDDYFTHILVVRTYFFKVLRANPNVYKMLDWEDIFSKAVLTQLFFMTLFNESRVLEIGQDECIAYSRLASKFYYRTINNRKDTKTLLNAILINLFKGYNNK